MHNWKVGDVGITCNFTGPEYNGNTVEVVLVRGNRLRVIGEHPDGDPPKGGWLLYAYNLKRPDKPEYDGNETTTWDDCPFKPKELVRIEEKPNEVHAPS